MEKELNALSNDYMKDMNSCEKDIVSLLDKQKEQRFAIESLETRASEAEKAKASLEKKNKEEIEAA